MYACVGQLTCVPIPVLPTQANMLRAEPHPVPLGNEWERGMGFNTRCMRSTLVRVAQVCMDCFETPTLGGYRRCEQSVDGAAAFIGCCQ